MLITMFVAAALAQTTPAVATPAITAPVPQAVTPSASSTDLAATVLRGQLLYLYDQAAWHTTDVMLKEVRDPGSAGVRGWIVEPEGKGLRVTFYGEASGRAVPVYSADFRDGKVSNARMVPVAERRPLAPEQQAMVDARSADRAAKLERCVAQPFNTVVLPPAKSGAPFEVYYLTPQTKPNAWPLGRHYRLFAGAGGMTDETRAFSRSCLAVGLAGLPKGARPAALFVTHVLDPVPTEIHVFTALASRIPLVVQTSNGRWLVDGRSIRPLAAEPKR